MSRGAHLIERAGHELRVSYSATAGDPGQTSGPPERCWPPEPPEFEIEKIELQWSIPDDLSPQPCAQRPIWLDVTDLLIEVGGDSFVEGVQDEILEKLADEDDAGPPSQYDDSDDYPYQPRLGDEE